MYLQNEHHFEGLYLSHFWLEFTKFGQGGPLHLRDGQIFGLYRMYQQNDHHFEGFILVIFGQNSIKPILLVNLHLCAILTAPL